MVSWSDDSEESGYEYSSGGSPIKIPATIEDPNYSGVDDEVMVMCEHGQPAKRHVWFSGISTGRRFLACGLDEANSCGVVQWDNIPKENEVQQGEHDEITPPLDNNISALKEQLGAMDAENKELKQKVDQLRSVQVAQGNVIRNLKFAHLKEKEKLSTERRNLEFHVADLVKASDKNKRKLKDIKDICDEE
ncbi:unnamed protein product [Triticum turgidum subsp. durum]|uniref:Zinc finger GRF-type domain-containing protein n=1 Tax=Triticum turgidum subsp. durum TaxID=4567 RepID=A0A9R1BKB2_TRITD|nr:unnamed protein product [Triticum turgidum subsp. durum]